MNTKKKVDLTMVLALFFGASLSVGIATTLWAVKELFGLKVGLATYMVLSLHALPSVVYYFRYIRGNTIHWKRNTMFLALFLIAQAIMGVGTFGFRFFVAGESFAVALGYAMTGVLFIKLTLVGTVVLPPILGFGERLLALILGLTFYVLGVIQSMITLLVILIFTPAITEHIANWLFEKANSRIRFHGPF